jgi:hypothetical protein
MLKKRKDNCMVGRHKFIFSSPLLSVQEAQLGGNRPTGHAREASGLLGKAQSQSRTTLMPRFARRPLLVAVAIPSPSAAAFNCRLTTTPPRSTSPHLRTSFLRRAQASPSLEGEGRQPPPPAPFPVGMCPVEIQLGRGRNPGRRFAVTAVVLRPGAQEAGGGGGGGDGRSRSMKSGDAVTAVLLEPPPVLL